MRSHKTWLYRFIRRYVPDGDEAYDVLQDSFVAAWSALPRYDPARPFEAWLRHIALNKCRDRARRNAVRHAALRLFGREPPQPASPPEGAQDAHFTALEAAIARLPLALKEPLILTALEGLSQKEAGALLGISTKAVETRVYRAKQRLAGLLDQFSEDESA